jgi:hypothetical protein
MSTNSLALQKYDEICCLCLEMCVPSILYWYMQINVRWPRTSHLSESHKSMVLLLAAYWVHGGGKAIWSYNTALRVAFSRPWFTAASNFEWAHYSCNIDWASPFIFVSMEVLKADKSQERHGMSYTPQATGVYNVALAYSLASLSFF